jgi:SAM-dependent methyltransferase
MTTRKLYVHFGCGFSAPDGWINFDASPTLRFERLPVVSKLYSKNGRRFPSNVVYGDVVKGLPLRAGTIDALFSNHVLEHIPLEDCRKALSNCFALLKPGGVFRLVVPDLKALIESYLRENSAGDPAAAHHFMSESCLGTPARTRGVVGHMAAAFGNTKHLWMWDEPAMFAALRAAGFKNIRRCSFGDSDDPMFRLVESEGHFENAVSLECRKD